MAIMACNASAPQLKAVTCPTNANHGSVTWTPARVSSRPWSSPTSHKRAHHTVW